VAPLNSRRAETPAVVSSTPLSFLQRPPLVTDATVPRLMEKADQAIHATVGAAEPSTMRHLEHPSACRH
jgi:hypothetical protein